MENSFLLIRMGKMRIFLLVIMFLLFYEQALCATFKGKVIDADTKKPIEGAVVVASWSEERATPTGSTTRLKDVKETLTDKNGEWVIEGPKGREMSNITAIITFITGTYITNTPEFIVFKPGYCSWPESSRIKACEGKMRTYNFTVSENLGEILELPRLTNREDRLRSLPSRVSGYGADKKQKEFIRLLNEERRHLGLEEY